MLRKFFKYDFKSISKIGIPMLIVIVVATLAGALNAYISWGNIDNMSDNPNFFNTFAMLGSMLFGYFITIVISLAATVVQIFTLIDFYRSTASDEAYLTFTLPASAHDILRSKLINGCLWVFIASIASTAGSLIIAAIENSVLLESFEGITLEEIVNLFEIPEGTGVMLLLLIIIMAVAFVNNQLLYYMALFFGSVIVRKNKVLASIGCVVGVELVYGVFLTIVISILSAIIGGVSVISGADIMLTINIILGVCIVLLTVLNVLFYYLTIHMMEKKLNLA